MSKDRPFFPPSATAVDHTFWNAGKLAQQAALRAQHPTATQEEPLPTNVIPLDHARRAEAPTQQPHQG